jgi:phosphoglycolate phosphatase
VTYKLVIFDFDGTLADSFPFFLEVFDTLADAHGFRRIDRTDLQALRGYDARQMMKHVGLPLWKIARVARHFKTLMAQNADRIGLFEGTSSMLRALAESGATLALVTSNSFENVCAILGPENISLFSHHECGASVFGKQSKLRRVVARSGVRKDDVLYIGDELRDMEAARAEGLAFGAVMWGYTCVESLLARSPEMVFSSVGEISGMLVSDSRDGKAAAGRARR